MQLSRAVAMPLGVLALGCLAGDGTGMGPPPPPPPPPGDVSFSADVQPIFTASCAVTGCHVGPNPASSMNLSEGQAYTNLVDVFSVQAIASPPPGRATTLFRVEPGNADSSYLIIKLEGDQGAVGGIGGTMPLSASPLGQMTIDLIRAWIDAGAEDN